MAEENTVMIWQVGMNAIEDIKDMMIALYDTPWKVLEEEVIEWVRDEESVVFVAYSESREAIGFAHCKLRHDYVEGTTQSPVGYIEGIYVQPQYRQHNVGTILIERCKDWARQQGCHEIASDCELSNQGSYLFHVALGFQEVNRIINFVQPL